MLLFALHNGFNITAIEPGIKIVAYHLWLEKSLGYLRMIYMAELATGLAAEKLLFPGSFLGALGLLFGFAVVSN